MLHTVCHTVSIAPHYWIPIGKREDGITLSVCSIKKQGEKRMIFRHKKSGVQYRMLFTAFNVETQRQSIVYMSMKTGVVFTKDAERFHAGMEYESQPQEDVEPNPNQAEFKFDHVES